MNQFTAWILNVVYIVVLLLLSPVILFRAFVYGKYRQGLKQKFFGLVPEQPKLDSPRKRIWFHAVSVGEINVLRPLLEMIRTERPNWECVVSTTSLTGMRLAEKLYANHHSVFYCPLDFSWATNAAMRRIKPDMLVLVEQEIWPNLFYAAKKHGAKLALINARFGESGYRRYKTFRFFFGPILKMLDIVAVQSETYAGWYHSVGTPGAVIEITGSMKFDGAQSNRNNPKTQTLGELAGLKSSDIVFLAGSTQAPEESYALDIFETLKNDWPNLKLILVPRHPERFESVAQMLTSRNAVWCRRTELKPETKTDCRLILIDCVGELGAWWGTAQIAFVGGSMGSRGGQNMIEPAAYGAAVSFGPNTKNFRDIVEMLLRENAAVIVRDQTEMQQFVRNCLENPGYAKDLGNRARDLVAKQIGATRQTLTLLERLLKSLK